MNSSSIITLYLLVGFILHLNSYQRELTKKTDNKIMNADKKEDQKQKDDENTLDKHLTKLIEDDELFGK